MVTEGSWKEDQMRMLCRGQTAEDLTYWVKELSLKDEVVTYQS